MYIFLFVSFEMFFIIYRANLFSLFITFAFDSACGGKSFEIDWIIFSYGRIWIRRMLIAVPGNCFPCFFTPFSLPLGFEQTREFIPVIFCPGWYLAGAIHQDPRGRLALENPSVSTGIYLTWTHRNMRVTFRPYLLHLFGLVRLSESLHPFIEWESRCIVYNPAGYPPDQPTFPISKRICYSAPLRAPKILLHPSKNDTRIAG